jgi:hypothetical protein
MRIVIAEEFRRSACITKPIVDGVIATLRENKIDVLIIDPFVTCHQVSENDNSAINLVATTWSNVADVTNCSVMLSHHSRKTGGEKVTVDDGRGASALVNAVRSTRSLNTMTDHEAEDAEIEERDRRRYFRADTGKANLTPPAEQADWYKLVSVDLGNIDPNIIFDESDNVGVVTAFDYPIVATPQTTVSDIQRAQDAIRAGGPYRANSQSEKEPWVGVPIAAALGLDLLKKSDKRAVTKLVKDWLKAGLLRQVVGQDGTRQARAYIEAGVPPATCS